MTIAAAGMAPWSPILVILFACAAGTKHAPRKSSPFSPPRAGRPGGSGCSSAFAILAAAFWGFAFLVLLPFWALPFWHCCLLGHVLGLPPPPAACSARPAGVALSISHLYPASKHKWRRHGTSLLSSLFSLLSSLFSLLSSLYTLSFLFIIKTPPFCGGQAGGYPVQQD